MGNEHHRVTLVTYLVMAIFVHFSSELPDDHLQKDSTVIKGLNATEVHSAWPTVLGTLTAVFCTALLIAMAVRYRLFRWCLARNRHDLLLDRETVNEFSQAGALEGDVPVRGMRGRMIHPGGSSEDDVDEDDDGFIEDNYIQASVTENTEDTDDELIIPEL